MKYSPHNLLIEVVDLQRKNILYIVEKSKTIFVRDLLYDIGIKDLPFLDKIIRL